MPTEQEMEARIEDIRRKRVETLLGAWKMVEETYNLRERCHLHPHLVAQVVENYLIERASLIHRSNIRGRIQRHKIAGLMAASIMKIRPVQLIDTTSPASSVSKDNEMLAAWHGLAVCSEGQLNEIRNIRELRMYSDWFGDLIYYLGDRPDGHSCSLIFETLSVSHFPGNLERVGEKVEDAARPD